MNLVRLLKTFLLSNAQNSSKMLQGFKQPQINPLTPDIHIQILQPYQKEKTYMYWKMYVHIRTFPYSMSKNLIDYGIFRKHRSLSKKVQGIHSHSDLSKC